LSRRRRRRGEEEEQATDIKSNNPHLAGGETKTWMKPAELGFKQSKLICI